MHLLKVVPSTSPSATLLFLLTVLNARKSIFSKLGLSTYLTKSFTSAVTINGQFPAPLIQINSNDNVVIPTHNSLTDPSMRRSTSIVRTPPPPSNQLLISTLALAWILPGSHFCHGWRLFCNPMSDSSEHDIHLFVRSCKSTWEVRVPLLEYQLKKKTKECSCHLSFWYHSHLSTQYCDGLRGPFVVYGRCIVISRY